MLDTRCKSCTFAIYKDITQTGCELNKLEMHKINGMEIVEAYDEEKEFYVIKGRICPFFRPDNWRKNIRSLDLKTTEEIIQKENTIKYQILLWENNDLDIIQTIKTIEKLTTQPQHVVILLRIDTKYDVSTINNWIKNPLISVRHNQLEQTDNFYTSVKNALHIVKQPFTILWQKNVQLEPDIFADMSHKIIYEGLRFSFACSTNEEIFLIPRKILNHYMSNNEEHFLETMKTEQWKKKQIITSSTFLLTQ